MLRFLGPELYVTVEGALIICGYKTGRNHTHNPMYAFRKKDQLRPNDNPPTMVVLFTRTKVAVDHHFSRTRHMDGIDDEQFHEINSDDASAWRAQPAIESGPANSLPDPNDDDRKQAAVSLGVDDSARPSNPIAPPVSTPVSCLKDPPTAAVSLVPIGVYDSTRPSNPIVPPVSTPVSCPKDPPTAPPGPPPASDDDGGTPEPATSDSSDDASSIGDEDSPYSSDDAGSTANGPKRKRVTTNKAKAPRKKARTTTNKAKAPRKKTKARPRARKKILAKPKKTPVLRPFHNEAMMIQKAFSHDIAQPSSTYMCYDRMVTAFKIFATTEPINETKWHDTSDVIGDLSSLAIIAVAGHVLGYSSCWSATLFNQWVSRWEDHLVKQYGDEETLQKAKTMYNEACHCRFIIECDLICTHKSKEQQLVVLKKKAVSSPIVETESAGSRVKYKATFAGSTHHFDFAQSVLSPQVLSRLIGDSLLPKQLSATMAERRKKLRADTLHTVINDVLLRYQDIGGFEIGVKESLIIAGYPSIGKHKLNDEYQDTVSMRKIMSPPINLETLFARTQVAMSHCKTRVQKRRHQETTAVISRADATTWRHDSHLRQYKVPCIFQRNSSSCDLPRLLS
jgi:hypothetical protein